jgi:hypothetical protein
MLFGPIEASARLPMLLYLPVLFCLLVQLIEWRSPRPLEFAEEAALCFALAIYTVTMSFNASYNPYFADIAAPASFETLTVLCMLATIWFLWNARRGWFFFFALLSYLCRPTGLLVLGLLGVAIMFCKPKHRRPWLTWISVAMVSCVLIASLYDNFYMPFMGREIGSSYPFHSVLSRWRYLRVDDLSRIGYVLFPSGIFPLISLLGCRWQDSWARIITIVSAAYFAFFYFQAFVALHHFAPVMVLPLVVFWRIYLQQQRRLRCVIVIALTATSIISLWLSLPQHFDVDRTVRSIGQRTAYLVGDYDTDYPEQVRHYELSFKLIPPGWDVEDPTKELVSGYGSIIYYSTRLKPPNTSINYLVQPLGHPVPPGFTEIADDKLAALYVKDTEQWFRDRFPLHLRTDYRSPLYDIPRSTLFYFRGIPEGQYSIDLKRLTRLKRLIKGGEE